MFSKATKSSSKSTASKRWSLNNKDVIATPITFLVSAISSTASLDLMRSKSKESVSSSILANTTAEMMDDDNGAWGAPRRR